MLTIIKIVLLLSVIIVPIRGPARRRSIEYKRPDKTMCSNYGINEKGELEEIQNEKKEDFYK